MKEAHKGPNPKGFAPWEPDAKVEAIVQDIEAVLLEYEEYLPLSIRQIFYRLVGNKGYPKDEGFYDKVKSYIKRGRHSGRIPWSSIRDDGVEEAGGIDGQWESPERYLKSLQEIKNYYSHPWHDVQPVRVKVLLEAAGMVPMIERALRRYRVPVASRSGFDSVTSKYDLFSDARLNYLLHDQRTVYLHLGDHDPSGWWMHRNLVEDLGQMCEDYEEIYPGEIPGRELIEVRRIALTPDQIVDLQIQTKPEDVKPTDSRSKGFLARGLAPAAQLEAVAPEVLTNLVKHSVEDTLDMDLLAATQEEEREGKKVAQERIDKINQAIREALS
jgi:hypothetical protein